MKLRHGVIAAAVTAALVLPTSGLAATPTWTDGTQAAVAVVAGTATTVTVSAASPEKTDVVEISAIKTPSFVAITSTDGNPAVASLTIAPPAALHGHFAVRLRARDSAGDTSPRTLSIVVTPDTRPVSLVGPGAQSRWAYVLAKTTARVAPKASARRVATVGTATTLGRPNLLLLLEQQRDAAGRLWVRARLPVLPNGTTGWIRRSALDKFQVVVTHLVIDRAALTAELYRNDVPVFHAQVGIGRPSAPTPAGEFYVREELRNFGDPFYGPVAFGTSARSAVLTDWPGGGFIGIHGTNQPQLLPGRVSHGCVRMRNADILRLARLMPLGTPITIR